MAKEGRLKRYRQRVKQYRQNGTFQNNERIFYQQLGGSDTKTYQQPDIKETERFWIKIWQPKKHKENAEWINNITRELEGLEVAPTMKINIDLPKTTLKRISNWKAQKTKPPIIGHLRGWHHQTSGNERQNWKGITQEN